ncbi:hypothetical protein EB118_01260 [bacterium]|nr:hypothetical protein [bacterium]NBX97872.1 hypothetical protein [bacterium]NDC93888.1 hypothetical protein [bacterium]NDD82835.1 hypothetical protein [bacterium]NDG28717.1 hypothetical protein [bacterium]
MLRVKAGNKSKHSVRLQKFVANKKAPSRALFKLQRSSIKESGFRCARDTTNKNWDYHSTEDLIKELKLL